MGDGSLCPICLLVDNITALFSVLYENAGRVVAGNRTNLSCVQIDVVFADAVFGAAGMNYVSEGTVLGVP